MRKDWADASRVVEVRSAARSWRGAGAIGADKLNAIEAAYPDDRPRTTAAWRVLIFTLTSVALNAAFLASSAVTHRGAGALFFGALLAGLTEALLRSRFGGNGSAAAASFWAVVYVIAGTGAYALGRPGASTQIGVTVCLVVAFLALAAACWRWGYGAYGALAAAPLFVVMARFPAGRLWWALGGALLAGAADRQLDRARLAPPYRRAFAGVFAVAAVALYVAVNRYSVEERLIEAMWGSAGSATPTVPASAALRAFSDAATALLPLLFVAWGIRSRRTLVLDLGLVFAALSLATLRYFVHVASPWVVLLACGAALVLAALAVNRFLRRGPNGERAGFTASPLYRSGTNLATAAVVAGLAPQGSAAPRAGGDLSPGGGRFGGGGATGSF